MVGQICNVLPHIFLVSYPGQGHVNPLLRLGKILASKGLLVTLSAPDTIGEKIRKANKNISEEPTQFGDGMIRFEFFDDESETITVPDEHAAHLEKIGKQKLPKMIQKNAEQGRPVCCLIYSCFIPWVAEVGHSLRIPSAPLWVQSAACFSAYYHYYHKLVQFPTESQPELDVQLPCMPLLKYDEIPSFLHPYTQYPSLTNSILGMFKHLDKNACVLMESFQELENDEINYMSKLCPIKPIGPLFLYSTDKTPGSTNVTDAKYLVDVFKVGLRLSRGDFENRVIPRDEIAERLIEATTGFQAGELKENAEKYKKAADEAVAEGGSSTLNLLDFLNELAIGIPTTTRQNARNDTKEQRDLDTEFSVKCNKLEEAALHVSNEAEIPSGPKEIARFQWTVEPNFVFGPIIICNVS
ncbi:OLC1v1003270C1 [Oldenlandia corymbosa var. corymbosa]|uniref:OLC1v1003270C1 n=1 Tax=Oldenlandia corymbosa var. corymbosa TaxID=529605 RepID=A0AAV1DAG8_OLDCO|nr:OLC1v1003270C1 [Oldenlandia corymbosa var. corymbosa]